MNLESKPTVKLLILCILITALSGCVWLRLLALKNQLGEFDRYFSSKVDNNGYTLTFKEPVVSAEDLIYLSKVYPSWEKNTPQRQRWFYDFKKIDADGKYIEPAINIVHQLGFNQQNLLDQWTFPPNLLAMTPAPFLELSLRGLGFSTIFRSKRQVKASFDKLSKVTTPIPVMKDIVAVLGKPLEVQATDYGSLYIYHFQLDTGQVEPGYEERKFMEFKLGFAAENNILLKVWGKFMGMKISVDYRKLAAKKGVGGHDGVD